MPSPPPSLIPLAQQKPLQTKLFVRTSYHALRWDALASPWRSRAQSYSLHRLPLLSLQVIHSSLMVAGRHARDESQSLDQPQPGVIVLANSLAPGRSEERRVGKECESRICG